MVNTNLVAYYIGYRIIIFAISCRGVPQSGFLIICDNTKTLGIHKYIMIKCNDSVIGLLTRPFLTRYSKL